MNGYIDMEIKRVKYLPELRKVAELADEIWHECFVDIISLEQIDYMVEKFQSLDAMCSQIENQKYSYAAIYDNGELCGYIGTKPEEEKFFLSKFYLRSDKRGTGMASEMMRFVFYEAKFYGKKSVYLTVNKQNERAIKFYKKMGYEIIDKTVTDIGKGFVMDDFIFECDLK